MASQRALAGREEGGAGGLPGPGPVASPGPGLDLLGPVARPATGAGRAAGRSQPPADRRRGHVVLAVVQAARENEKLPVRSADPRAPVWRTDDDLTAYYIRRAAAAARQLPPQVGPAAFLLGLGVAMDDSSFVHGKPALNEVWEKIEPNDQRPRRLLVLGTPTIFKRHNATRHFTLSAALAVLSGPQGAEVAGFSQEIVDSRGGDGFSFSDLCTTWRA